MHGRRISLLVLAIVACLVWAASAQGAVVDEFSGGLSAAAGPDGITSAPGGALWFAEFDGDRIARVAPGGAITEFPSSGAGLAAGAEPSQVAVTSNGMIWFTEYGTGEIGEIDPSTGTLIGEYPLPSGSMSEPEGIVVGPDGALWFTERGSDAIGRLDPSAAVPGTSDGITSFDLPTSGHVALQPVDLVDGPDGQLWVTLFGTGAVASINPAMVSAGTSAGITTYPLPTAGSGPEGIVVGPDDDLWVAEDTAGKVAQIVPSSVSGGTSAGITEYPVGGSPVWLADGHDGALWVTDNVNRELIRFDPGTHATMVYGAAQGVNGDATADAPDTQGDVWFTEFDSDRIGEVVLAVPVNTDPPVISGSPAVGQTVTCSTGSWTNDPTTFAFTWLLDGQVVAGQTSSSFVIGGADSGHSLTCQVTASNDVGPSSATTSAGVTPTGPSGAPGNLQLPQIVGTPVVGDTVMCTTGDWSWTPTDYAYAWLRDGQAIPDADSASYTIAAADGDHALSCQVTATNMLGSSQALSAPSTVAVEPLANLTPPVIDAGSTPVTTARAGTVVTCRPGTYNDSPTARTYYWFYTETAYPATGRIQIPRPVVTETGLALRGQTITVPDLPAFASEPVKLASTSTISCAEDATLGSDELTTRSATVRLLPIRPVLATHVIARLHGPSVTVFVRRPSITAGVGVGGTDRCDAGAWAHFPTSFTYKWFSEPIQAASKPLHVGQTLAITTADESRHITCQVQAFNGAGSSPKVLSNTVVVPATAPVNTAAPVVTLSTELPDRPTVDVTSSTHATLAGYGPNDWSYYTTIAEKAFLGCDTGQWNRTDLTYTTQWLITGQASDIIGDKRGNDYISITDPFNLSETVAGDQLRFDFAPGNTQEPTILNGTVTCTVTATTRAGRSSVATAQPVRIWNGCDVGLEPWDQKILYNGPLCDDYIKYYGGP